MLERVLDIAVYALVLGMVVLGATRLLDQRRTGQTLTWIESVVHAVPRTANLSDGFGAAGADLVPALLAGSLLPAGMIDRANQAGAVLRNAYGGGIDVRSTGASYQIATDQLPPVACIALLARAPDFAEAICVNAPPEADCVAPGGGPGLDPAQVCTRPENAIMFKIRK